MAQPAPLRVGLVGSGFIARFHIQSLVAVRGVVVAGVYSPTPEHREAAAALANTLDLGPARAYDSLGAMLPEVDAVWILGPNDTRLGHMTAIRDAVLEGRASLAGVACEKPLGRTLAEARAMLRLAEEAGLNHGYLENQVFAPGVVRGREVAWARGARLAGRPYLARAAEEHSGPHNPWFWDGTRQGGGVLNDMMCHSLEVARFLLTDPQKGRESLRPVSASATIASLKWTRPEYARRLREATGLDYATRPAEDFARASVEFEDEAGHRLIAEATTSWSYVGPGLRIVVELLGPEYSLELTTLNSGPRLFFSREVRGEAGEDLVEKQAAEQGLMPLLEDEAATYGYVAENRHMVESFSRGRPPRETFADGVAVAELLAACYRSAELGRVVALPEPELEGYVPPVARGEWRP